MRSTVCSTGQYMYVGPLSEVSVHLKAHNYGDHRADDSSKANQILLSQIHNDYYTCNLHVNYHYM